MSNLPLLSQVRTDTDSDSPELEINISASIATEVEEAEEFEDEATDYDQSVLDRENPSRELSIWEHFTAVSDGRAVCNICRKTYNYATTTSNLKAHLARRHIDAFQDCEELVRRRERVTPIKPRGPRTLSTVWNHFEKLNKTQAECLECKKQLSYKSTVHNLKMHLSNKHPSLVECPDTSQLTQEPEVTYEDVQYLELGDDEDSEESMQMASEGRLWEYFQSEGRKRARCGLCEAPVRADRLGRHLADRHPGVMAAVVAQDTDDEDLKQFPQSRNVPLRAKKRKSKVVHQSSSEDEPVKRSKEEPRDSFMQYIATLLKETPRELYLQVQMDIVNVIMKARLSHQREAAENAGSKHNRQLRSSQTDLDANKDNVDATQALIDVTTQQRVKCELLAKGDGKSSFKESNGDVLVKARLSHQREAEENADRKQNLQLRSSETDLDANKDKAEAQQTLNDSTTQRRVKCEPLADCVGK